ncbi:uncharacterized protein LOC132035139 [Lycium ferocissimum]|uniref:uncharacterized protein LOC132035139 n=1 Tax=Lycium ferocissimum TaxID=112874 RepID=UPI002814B4D2|nr:uncharacterized protein LOC132035139 [Lycium ferocissimum]
MFASQLLRILQTLPTDADHGGCILDTPYEKAIMKDNQNGGLSRSNRYKEANSLAFPTEDFLDSNGYGSRKETLACDTKDRDNLWKVSELYESVFFDDISRSNNDKIRASTVENDLNEALPNIITSRRYGNPFAYDTKDRDQQWNTPEFECSVICDFLDEKEKGSIFSDAPFIETDTELYTEKRIKEYELPELIVCYKESNYNIVKDICVDMSIPVADTILTESWNNAQPGTYVSIPADEDQHSNTSESADIESCSPGGSKSSVEYENNEEEYTESPVPNGLNPTSEDNGNEDADRDTYLEDLILIFGPKSTRRWKYTNLSEIDSSAEESGIENSQQSNFDSDQTAQQPDLIPNEEAALESQNAVSAVNNEAENSVPATDLFYNSKLGTEAIIFDFNSTKPASTSNMVDQGVKNFPEPSLRLEASTGHKDGTCNSLSDASQVHIYNSNNVHGQYLESQYVANLEDKSLGGLLLDSHGQFADGEASFSALGPDIVYSGRMSYCESSSLGSDGSTTSTGSFAFPILQSEWNSSPVRMGQAESSHFRKHKRWRQGILCCRF